MDKSETIEEFMNTAIQEEVENLGIELSKDDCEEIKWAVLGDIGMLIQNKIHEVIDYNELFERNEDADKTLPHYKVLWKNGDEQKDFKVMSYFKTEKDAHEYTRSSDFYHFADIFKIILVNEEGEKEIYQSKAIKTDESF